VSVSDDEMFARQRASTWPMTDQLKALRGRDRRRRTGSELEASSLRYASRSTTWARHENTQDRDARLPEGPPRRIEILQRKGIVMSKAWTGEGGWIGTRRQGRAGRRSRPRARSTRGNRRETSGAAT